MSEGRQQTHCLPPRPGKVCFDFTGGCASRCHHASCAKQHPTNNCPYQRVLIPVSVPGQRERGTKFPSGDQTVCFSKAELLPYRSRQCQAAAVGGLYRLYLHRRFLYLPRNPPLLQSPWRRAALGEGLILCPRLPSRCCQGQPPVVGAGGAGTDHDD